MDETHRPSVLNAMECPAHLLGLFTGAQMVSGPYFLLVSHREQIDEKICQLRITELREPETRIRLDTPLHRGIIPEIRWFPSAAETFAFLLVEAYKSLTNRTA